MYIAPVDDGYCFTVRKIKVAKFKEPQIKRFAQRLFVMSCLPPAYPSRAWVVDNANIQLFSQTATLLRKLPDKKLNKQPTTSYLEKFSLVIKTFFLLPMKTTYLQ